MKRRFFRLPARAQYSVAGKVVLITGAGSGIGAELARQLSHQGAHLLLVDIDETALGEVAAQLGAQVFTSAADVRDREAMAAAVARGREYFGRIDVVIANAGVTPVPATLRGMDPGDFDRVLGINLTGAFNTIHPALDAVIGSGGHVVVISSVAAFAPGMGGAPYMISKAGVEQLGRALRVELGASGASAGISYFGIVDTPMAQDMFDGHDLGQEMERLLPWPLNRHITADAAAVTIIDGICRRAPRTISPIGWLPYALLRGVINPILDRKLSSDRRIHTLLNAVDGADMRRPR